MRSLDGSAHARRRLEAVLETIVGGMTVREACERLGIGGTAFHRMRAKALGAALASLEPKALGRPPGDEAGSCLSDARRTYLSFPRRAFLS